MDFTCTNIIVILKCIDRNFTGRYDFEIVGCSFIRACAIIRMNTVPCFFARHFITFFMYIEMNNKLTFTEMTLLVVGKIWLNFFLFIEKKYIYTFWPSFTDVVLFRVGQILNIVKIELKCGFIVT